MDVSDIELREAVKLGFGFGIGFAAASVAISIIAFILYLPVMAGL